MSAVVWIIGGVVVVDLAIVAWFVTRELLERRRVRREVARLDELWTASAAPLLQLVRTSAGRSPGRGNAPVRFPTIARPILEQWPRARRVSFVAFTAALITLLVVVAVDTAVPLADRAATGGGTNQRPWTFEPGQNAGGTSSGSANGSSAPSPGAAVVAPPPWTEPGPEAATADAPGPGRVAAEPRSMDEIRLRWVRVPDAVGYLIERWEMPADASAGWNVIGSTEADATTYVDTGLESGTTYYYRVSAVAETGEPALSDVVSATTLPGPPDAPVIVAVTNGSSIKIEWGDVNDEAGYRIERASAEVGGGWEAIATVGQDVTLHVDGGLAKGTTYSYRVVATSGSGDSLPSNVVTVTAGAENGASSDPGSSSEEPAVEDGPESATPIAE